MDEKLKNAIEYYEDGRVNFPTLCACPVCGGVTDSFPHDKETAYKVALVQHGYYIKEWEGMNVANKEFFPHMCNCKCKHDFEIIKVEGYVRTSKCKHCNVIISHDSSD